MKKLYIFIFAILLSFSVSAQIIWQKSLGGTSYDDAYSIVQTIDNGYIVAGRSASDDGDVTVNYSSDDYWVVKLDASGNIQWQKSLGGTAGDKANDILQTPDSGYIVAGYSWSNNYDVTGNHGSGDYWIVKLNVSGAIEWQKCYGGTGYDEAFSIIATDSGYIVAGRSNSNDGDVTGNHGLFDYWVVKLDALGIIQWQKSLGGTNNEIAHSIIQTYDSSYVIAGRAYSNDGDITGNHGSEDSWIIKLDLLGNIQWQKSLGGTDLDGAKSIVQTSDSGYAVACYSNSNNGDVTGNHGILDYWVVKLDASGNIQWQNSLGGTSGDYPSSIIQSSDNGYIVAGSTLSNDGDVTSNHGGYDYWIVKLDSLGAIQHEQSFGGTGDDEAYSFIQTSDSANIVAGLSYSNNGDVSGNHGNKDFWVVKLGLATGIGNLYNSNTFNIYPNPSTNSFSITANHEFDNAQLTIFNVLGVNVYTSKLAAGANVIEAEYFSSGIYYVQVIEGGKMWTGKIIKK